MSKIKLLLFIILIIQPLLANAYESGSTGADGALNVTTQTLIPLPPSGVLNYSSITVASGATLQFGKNAANTPV